MSNVSPIRRDLGYDLDEKASSPKGSSDILLWMPTNPKAKAEWLLEKFETRINAHIRHLKRFKGLPNKSQALFCIWIFDDYLRIWYGSLTIDFPYEFTELAPFNWIKVFDIFIDNQGPIALDIWLSTVPEVTNSVSTRTSRAIDKLMPPVIKPKLIPIASRSIRIQLKK